MYCLRPVMRLMPSRRTENEQEQPAKVGCSLFLFATTQILRFIGFKIRVDMVVIFM